jgi:hypothetical protein
VKIGNHVADLVGQSVTPVSITLTPNRAGGDHATRQVLRTRQTGDPGPAAPRTAAENNVISIDKPLIGNATPRVLPSALEIELGDPLALGGPLAFTIRRGQRLKASGLDIKLGGELPTGLSTGDLEIELLTDAGGRIYRNPYQPPDQRPDNEHSPLVMDLTMDIAVYATDPEGNAVLTQTVLGVQASGVVTPTAGVFDIESVIAMDLDLLGIARAPTNLVLELITDPTAQPEPDLTAPRLLASLPSAGGELPVNAGIELIFDEPIDIDRARAGGIVLQLLPSGRGIPTLVPTVIESHGAAVVIRPIAALPPSASLVVSLGDVVDLAGNQLMGVKPMTFSTASVVDSDAPLAIASVHPGVPCALTGGDAGSPGRCVGDESGAKYQPFSLAANEPIEVTFTQPVMPLSIIAGTKCSTGTVRIEEVDGTGACRTAVPGTLIKHERALAFVPDVAWQVGKHYRLTLVSGKDPICNFLGEICGSNGIAASFDPLGGNTIAAAGGPNLVIDFTGAAPTNATLMIASAAPFTDVNGSGFVEIDEPTHDENRVALRITGANGLLTDTSFNSGMNMSMCPPPNLDKQAPMYLSGTIPVELLPLAHDCVLPGGEAAPSCLPVALSPQVMYGTSVAIVATAVDGPSRATICTTTGEFVMRIREPATGYIIDDHGTPTLVASLDIYLDAPDLSLPAFDHDVHSKPLSVNLRGPLRFLPDGRIAISVSNTSDVPITINVVGQGNSNLSGSIGMLVPQGEMKLQLVSPPLRGGL